MEDEEQAARPAAAYRWTHARCTILMATFLSEEEEREEEEGGGKGRATMTWVWGLQWLESPMGARRR